jgi:hypothetical protein
MSSTIILESSWDTANCCNQVVDQVLDFVASDLAERFFPKFWVQVLTENALVAIVPRQNSTRRELILESIDFQRAGLKLQIDVTMLHGRVAGLLTVFGYYASSICITVVLAGFLAILFDPVVVILEKLHLPRGVAAAGIVLAGMGLIGLLGHELYGRAMTFAEELPVYTSKISANH